MILLNRYTPRPVIKIIRPDMVVNMPDQRQLVVDVKDAA